MSIRAIDWAFRQKVGSATMKFVLVKLADNANEHNGLCWPSLDTICLVTELAKHTVISHIKALSGKNLVKIVHRKHGDVSLSNHYILNLDGNLDCTELTMQEDGLPAEVVQPLHQGSATTALGGSATTAL